MQNVIDKIELAFAAFGGFLGWFWGGFDGFLYALIVFVVLDYFTGLLAAGVRRELSSEIGFKGIAKKACIFILVGLANIVVMYALFFMGPRQALVLDVLKALFVFLVSGFTAGFLSLCGGLLSLAVMWVLYYLLPVRPTWFILSVCGALAHNVGQLLGAGVIISSSLSLYYAPVMLVLGLVMGALTSVTLRALLPALGKMGFNTHENRPE